MSTTRLTQRIRLNPKTWNTKVGAKYREWISSGFTSSSETSRAWLQLFERQTSEGVIDFRSEPYQREAILRLIYMLEFGGSHTQDDYLSMNQIAVQMATGSGKTGVLTNIVSWAKSAVDQHVGADLFILLCPNTIVRQRLWEALKGENAPFAKIGFPNPPMRVLNLAEDNAFGLDNCDLILTNIHRVFETNRNGSVIRDFLATSGKRFLVLNDEAHNSVTGEYDRVMELFSALPNFVARIDLTATPKRPDLVEIPSHFIFEYPPLDGIEGRGTYSLPVYRKEEAFLPLPTSYQQEGGRQILKKPTVVRPIPDEVTFEIKGAKKPIKVTGRELCLLLSKDPEHRLQANEIRERHNLPSSVQKSAIASSPVFKKALLQKGNELLERRKEVFPEGKSEYKPILFAVAMNRKEADQTAEILTEMGLRVLLVIGKEGRQEKSDDSVEVDDFVSCDAKTGKEIPKEALRELVNKLGKPSETLVVDDETIQCDYDAVVSVYMLKEGWDVNCVEVMVLLRPFDSRLFAEQTIGRGLRIRRDLVDPSIEQLLYVVEPPNWGLDDLWAELGAEVEGTDTFRCRRILSVTTSASGDKASNKELDTWLSEIEDNNLKVSLEGARRDREKLALTVLENEKFRITPKETLKYLRDEASHGKSTNVEAALCGRLKDKDLREEVSAAIKEGDHLGVLQAIENYLAPERTTIPKCRTNLRDFLTLKPKEGTAEDDARSILNALSEDFKMGHFDTAFEGLSASPEWKITGMRFTEIEIRAGGKKVVEKWPAEFHEYVMAGDDGKDYASLLETMEGWLHNLSSRLEEELIRVRLPQAPASYSQISAALKVIPSINACLSDGLWLNADESRTFKSAWDHSVDKLYGALSDWLERKVHGIEGKQNLPDFPELPTGKSDLNDYTVSLFESEYTQASYERYFAQLIDGDRVFQTTDQSLSQFNGMKVITWTTSHGIRIPLSMSRNYRPDFLIALGDEDNQLKHHLLVEIKREDKENDSDVQLKARAADAFCSAHEHLAYGIITLKELPKRKKAA